MKVKFLFSYTQYGALLLLPLGKWCRVERFDVPENFLANLLSDMPSAFLNTTKPKRHLHLPLWKNIADVLLYKIFEMNEVVTALERQREVEIKPQNAFNGDGEVTTEALTGKDALEAAKAREHGANNPTPTLHVQIIVGHGEGRAREFEIIWWPKMFSSSGHGKLRPRNNGIVVPVRTSFSLGRRGVKMKNVSTGG